MTKDENLISVAEFEAKVLEREEIVIKIRAPAKTKVADYDYDRKAAAGSSVSEWLETRIKPKISGNEVEVISGKYAVPHGRTKLETLRKSYES